MGRPKKYGVYLEGRSVRAPADVWDMLVSKCQAEGVSLNDGAIAAIKAWVDPMKLSEPGGFERVGERPVLEINRLPVFVPAAAPSSRPKPMPEGLSRTERMKWMREHQK